MDDTLTNIWRNVRSSPIWFATGFLATLVLAVVIFQAKSRPSWTVSLHVDVGQFWPRQTLNAVPIEQPTRILASVRRAVQNEPELQKNLVTQASQTEKDPWTLDLDVQTYAPEQTAQAMKTVLETIADRHGKIYEQLSRTYQDRKSVLEDERQSLSKTLANYIQNMKSSTDTQAIALKSYLSMNQYALTELSLVMDPNVFKKTDFNIATAAVSLSPLRTFLAYVVAFVVSVFAGIAAAFFATTAKKIASSKL